MAPKAMIWRMRQGASRALLAVLLLAVFCLLIGTRAAAEDGYALWLRHQPLAESDARRFTADISSVALLGAASPVAANARDELAAGLSRLLLRPIGVRETITSRAIVLARLDMLPAGLRDRAAPPGSSPEAYRISQTRLSGQPVLMVAARGDAGLLYGAFEVLRRIGEGSARQPSQLIGSNAPAVSLRILNHWDNPDGFVERGYAGRSIFDWWRLPGQADMRLTDYARANASIGINGVVPNNVNARAEFLTDEYITKAARLAAILRPWGIRLYLSVRFSSPMELGATSTADPLDPAVRAWWRARADALYAAIPDFGGFLVKANSEGQPGPQDYGRSHADGANMLAAAVGERGTIFWRAFVYSSDPRVDRVMQAYDEFRPLDGQFADNVIIQVKNGPLDFQPREPFSPLFGAMRATNVGVELQITKEYLGFATHLAYLGPMWAELFAADTHAGGDRSSVADVIDGSWRASGRRAIAGVANIGSDRTWSGSHLDQANWYAFGRMAWDPRADPAAVARSWAAQTFSRDPSFTGPMTQLMMESREAVVDYMTPLGLAHLMGTGHHHGPAPWVNDLSRPEWNPVYYHRADRQGIGIDRTASGTGALEQYHHGARAAWSDPRRIDQRYLLWFHRVGWDEVQPNGHTLWENLVRHYDRGADWADAAPARWAMLAQHVDAPRHRAIAEQLAVQATEARWWRDASIAYFAQVSGRLLPAGVRAPEFDLATYQARRFPYAPGNP